MVDEGEQDRLAADVGKSSTGFLRNHGVITLGASVGAALMQMDQLMLACEIQACLFLSPSPIVFILSASRMHALTRRAMQPVHTQAVLTGAAVLKFSIQNLWCALQTWAEVGGPDNLLLPPHETIEKTFEVTRTFAGNAGFGIMEFCAMMRHLDKLDDSYRL